MIDGRQYFDGAALLERKRVDPREWLPQSVSYMGEVGSWVVCDPDTRDYYAVPFKPGLILVEAPDARTLFMLRPIAHAGRIRKSSAVVHCAQLHERFTHRAADEFYNLIVPPFRQPRPAGNIAILTYSVQKGEDDELTEYVHHFEEEGVAPVYAPIAYLGHGQYVIPPGPFQVTDEGIDYFDEG